MRLRHKAYQTLEAYEIEALPQTTIFKIAEQKKKW